MKKPNGRSVFGKCLDSQKLTAEKFWLKAHQRGIEFSIASVNRWSRGTIPHQFLRRQVEQAFFPHIRFKK